MVALKVIKMWTPKPGQKFNLATSLNIALPPTLDLVPGPPLTPEQLEEVQKLLRQQKLKHVTLDRKQLKKLIAAQRIAEDTKKPEKNKPGDEGRKREAKHEPHAAAAEAPHTASAAHPDPPRSRWPGPVRRSPTSNGTATCAAAGSRSETAAQDSLPPAAPPPPDVPADAAAPLPQNGATAPPIPSAPVRPGSGMPHER